MVRCSDTGVACATLKSVYGAIPAELVEWHERRTLGPDRSYVVTVEYRDKSGALCTTTADIDELTWMQVRRSMPCVVPYRGSYTVSACP